MIQPFTLRITGLAALLISSLLIPNAFGALIPIEQTISARSSIRSWTSSNIPSTQLLEVLRSAYGYYGDHRSIPHIGNEYSLDLFVANATGTYRYIPEQNVLATHDPSVNKETLRSRFNQGYPADANAVIIVVWNRTRMDNQYFASAQAGLIAQNLYLAAVSLDLGTVCVGLINSDGLRDDLKLSSAMTPLLIMPIGYVTTPYPSATPDYTRMAGNLPSVQFSQMSFANALNNLVYAQAWSASQSLTLQELSQILWASYGYCSTSHRTVPSAYGIYPFKIWFINATGTYEYVPATHTVTLRLQGNKISEISNVFGSQNWVANAPTIFLVVYDSSLGGDGGIVLHEFPEVDAGTIVQNMLLEATAWNLSGNVVSQGLEVWNGAGAVSIRSILGMSSSLIPLYAVPVGHEGVIPEFPSAQILAVLIIVVLGVAVAFRRKGSPSALTTVQNELSRILFRFENQIAFLYEPMMELVRRKAASADAGLP